MEYKIKNSKGEIIYKATADHPPNVYKVTDSDGKDYSIENGELKTFKAEPKPERKPTTEEELKTIKEVIQKIKDFVGYIDG